MNFWKLFDTEGKVYKTLDAIGNLFIWNFLWLLCCIPIITIGASTCALCSVNVRQIKGEQISVSDFFEAFRENFVFGLFFELAVVILLLPFAGAAFLVKDTGIVENLIGYTGLIILLAVGSYVLPTRVCFLGSWKQILKLSLYFTLKMPFYFLFKLLLMILFIALFLIIYRVIPEGLILLAASGGSILNWCMQFVYWKIVKKFGVKENET